MPIRLACSVLSGSCKQSHNQPINSPLPKPKKNDDFQRPNLPTFHRPQNGACKNSIVKNDIAAKIMGFNYATSPSKKNETQMMVNLVSTGPISICADAATWQDYSSGIIKHGPFWVGCLAVGLVGWLAVGLVGWLTVGWLVGYG